MRASPFAAVTTGWEDVPVLVTDLYRRLVGDAFKVARAVDDLAGPNVRVYLHCDRPEVYLWDDQSAARWRTFAKAARYRATLAGYTVAYGDAAPREEGWVLVKNAAFLRPAADAFAAAQAPLGGPRPLSASIVGGLLGAGIGYGGGYLAERLLGDRVEPGRLRRTAAILGGGLGAAPGVWWGTVNARHPEQTGGGLGAWFSGYPFRPRDIAPPAPSQKAASAASEAIEKACAAQQSGALFLPTIPVDAFNRVVWQDAHRAPNPYGAKDPFGDNEQPLTTPPPVAAAVSGIVAGAGAATGSPVVTPWSVALTAATTAGKGYLAGLAFGKTLGALAGLRPEVQDRLQQIGMWGGLVTGAFHSLYGR